MAVSYELRVKQPLKPLNDLNLLPWKYMHTVPPPQAGPTLQEKNGPTISGGF